MTKKNTDLEWSHTIMSAIALFAFLYYVQYLLDVQGNLWISTLILWLLLSVVMIFSPFMRKQLTQK